MHAPFANPRAKSCWLSCAFQVLWHSRAWHTCFEAALEAGALETSEWDTPGAPKIEALVDTWREYRATLASLAQALRLRRGSEGEGEGEGAAAAIDGRGLVLGLFGRCVDRRHAPRGAVHTYDSRFFWAGEGAPALLRRKLVREPCCASGLRASLLARGAALLPCTSSGLLARTAASRRRTCSVCCA